jgi:hypothetical protein
MLPTQDAQGKDEPLPQAALLLNGQVMLELLVQVPVAAWTLHGLARLWRALCAFELCST